MRRILYLFLLLAAFIASPGCSQTKTEKITDPERIAELRTRGGDIKDVLNPFGKISIQTYINDWKRLLNTPEATLKAAKAKDKGVKPSEVTISGWDKFDYSAEHFKEQASPGYSPALTGYFCVVLLIFLIILIVKVIRTFLITSKKK